jgi:hypothetical protein
MGDCNWRIWRKHVKKDLQNIFRVQFWGQFEACKQKWWKLNYSFFLLIHYALLLKGFIQYIKNQMPINRVSKVAPEKKMLFELMKMNLGKK